ncbi:uncharacterized protein IL334_003969 [Kwoniella shivajii]|uniref:Inositol polyphosphate-related phosphatase domain-containing protein n=1 Tax=Kwoniella shivajii TaxID=564305 RepID=A0ABZ1CZM4_9TREE|nr:hypothetical protein IL334_003969 [Kwoniella shivajii]
MPVRFHLIRRGQNSNQHSSSNSNNDDDQPIDSSRVKSRLHALFTPSHNSSTENDQDQLEAGPCPSSPGRSSLDTPGVEINIHSDPQLNQIGSEDVIRSKTFPLDSPYGTREGRVGGIDQTFTIPKKKERDAIKILMVTWNMGDALPKGDLSVLFGQIPPYQSQSPNEQIPELPVENGHPYHIVVIAGQECPTLSGAPRGLGGGLVKGVTLRHRKEKEKEKEKDKDKEKEKEKEMEKDDEGITPDEKKLTKATDIEKAKEKSELKPPRNTLDVDRDDAGSRSADSSDEEETKGSSEQRSRAASPMTPHTPFLHRHQPAVAPKGWSQMLDDYFCGPNARTSEPIPSSYDSSSPVPRDTPFLPHPPPSALPAPPSLLRSVSAPITPVASPITIPPRVPAMITSNLTTLSPSPLVRSRSSFDSSSSSSAADGDESFLMMQADHGMQSSSPKRKIERPEIVIPNEEPSQTNSGNGSYVHVVKERLLGMYLTVYVYKGCEHLIQGMDKDLVTAGLAGGRVGNKGGIGISLKLADHRFLFVNSHLAAHTGRMHARLSNIAKIKSELRLDCFLPKDDPRAAAEDITDRYDTVFWCGDLNFRIELSRLHADWLIEQKKYGELLMWDQLKLAMRDPKMNPFPGFDEGPIDFPCTFKYDVWKSVRATNRDVRRTLKRRKSSASAVSVDLGSSVNVSKGLSYVPEGDAIEKVDGDDDEDESSRMPDQLRRSDVSDDDITEGDFSRRSFESSRYTSGANSMAGTDAEEDSDDMPMTHKHRPFDVAIKEKTRHFLGLVKMDGILTPSPGKRGGLGRRVSVKRRMSIRKRNQDDYAESRRTSMSSFVSHPDTDRPTTPLENERRVSTSSRNENPVEDGFIASTSDGLAVPASKSESGYSSSPPRDKDRPPPFTRRLSIMKRTMSGRSVKDGMGEDEEEEEAVDEVDRREGVYDTSKKQRVPSWCDRVLWKAHILSDLEDDEEPIPRSVDLQLDSHTPFHRLSNALTHLSGHIKLQMGRTSSMDPSMADRLNLRIRTSVSPERDPSGTSTPSRFVDTSVDTSLLSSPSDSPDSSLIQRGEGLIPLPRRRSSPFRPSTTPSPSSPSKASKQHISITSSAPATRSPSKLVPSLSMTRSGSAPGNIRPILSNRPNSASGAISSSLTTSTNKSGSRHEPEPEYRNDTITSDNSVYPMSILDNTKQGGKQRPRSNSDSIGIEVTNSTSEKKKGRSSDGLMGRPINHNEHSKIEFSVPTPNSTSMTSSPERKSSLRIFDHDKRVRTISNSAPSAKMNSSLIDSTHDPEYPNQEESSIHRTITTPPTLNHTSSSHSNNHGPGHGHGRERESDKNAFMRFLKDLPGWLHRSSSATNPDKQDITLSYEEAQEKKWKKGEVRCLHYGTIDDAGMRQLEGRSDHRPAIFAGAVYI